MFDEKHYSPRTSEQESVVSGEIDTSNSSEKSHDSKEEAHRMEELEEDIKALEVQKKAADKGIEYIQVDIEKANKQAAEFEKSDAPLKDNFRKAHGEFLTRADEEIEGYNERHASLDSKIDGLKDQLDKLR